MSPISVRQSQHRNFEPKDVHWVIGSRWKQRFIGEIDGEEAVFPAQWSVKDKKWQPYRGRNHWEINLTASMEKFDSDWGWGFPLLDINYGVGERIQLKFKIPWILIDEDGQELASGLGNSELEIKWRFLDEENNVIPISVYPQFTFNSLQRSIDRGIVDDGSEFVLPFQIAKTFGDTFIYIEVGYGWLEHGPEKWDYGIAVEHGISEKFKLLGEIHGIAEQDFQEDGLIFNLWFKWHFHKNVALMGSAMLLPACVT